MRRRLARAGRTGPRGTGGVHRPAGRWMVRRINQRSQPRCAKGPISRRSVDPFTRDSSAHRTILALTVPVYDLHASMTFPTDTSDRTDIAPARITMPKPRGDAIARPA